MKKNLIFVFTFFITFSLFAEKPIINNLQAFSGSSTKINLIWNNPTNPDQEITKYFVYRTVKPVTDFSQISNLSPVAELSSFASSYTDTVNDYRDYFYVVLAYTDKIYDLILPNINSLTMGVHLTYHKQENSKSITEKERLYPEGSLREKPLPYIDYIEGLNSTDVLSQLTVDKTKKFSGKTTSKAPLLNPYYFEEDLISPDGGDDYLLFDILKNSFVQKKYAESIVMLERLAGTNINPKIRNRTYFYIGESQYLIGNYAEAVKTFVRVEKEYPALTKKWIDSALDHMLD